MCETDAIQMEDFEYYEDLEGKKKQYSEDDMRCKTYKNKYIGGKNKNE